MHGSARYDRGVGDDHVARPLDRDLAAAVAETMQALATPSRLLILDCLRRAPLPVTALADAVGMRQSAVSHQLRLLRYLGLVTGERQGRHVVYALHDSHVGDLIDEAVRHIEHLRLAAGRPDVPAEAA